MPRLQTGSPLSPRACEALLLLALAACTPRPIARPDTGGGTDAPVDTSPGETADTGDPGASEYPTVDIAPGSFTMGSPADEAWREGWETLHAQALTRAYALGVHEVTQGLFVDLLGWNPVETDVDAYGHACGESGVDLAFPVACVTWFDAVALANALSERHGLAPAYAIDGTTVTWDRDAEGWRLPTEAEWEYAARAGGEGTYGVTAEAAEVCAYANVADETATASSVTNNPFPCDDGAWTLTVPGSYAPTAWGVHDMLGSVYEWAWDWSGDYPDPAPDDHAGPDEGEERVRRGGGWHSGLPYARPAYRGDTPPDETLFTLGVRLARNR